jgi:hypothetical protein
LGLELKVDMDAILTGCEKPTERSWKIVHPATMESLVKLVSTRVSLVPVATRGTQMCVFGTDSSCSAYSNPRSVKCELDNSWRMRRSPPSVTTGCEVTSVSLAIASHPHMVFCPPPDLLSIGEQTCTQRRARYQRVQPSAIFRAFGRSAV